MEFGNHHEPGHILRQMLGLPLATWLLIVLAGGLGLGTELVFYLRHRNKRRQEG